jgi:hypothetical protein
MSRLIDAKCFSASAPQSFSSFICSVIIASVLYVKDYPYENSTSNYGENTTSKKHCKPRKYI